MKTKKMLKKFTLAMLILSTLFVSCEELIDEQIPESFENYTTKVKFSIGEGYVLDPSVLVLTLTTPKMEITGAKIRFEKNSDGTFTTENFPMECGDYIVKSWTAYDDINQSIAIEDGEVTYNPCDNGNIIPEGILIDLPAKTIPFNQFSALHPNVVGSRRYIEDITEVGDGQIMMLSNAAAGTTYTRLTTKGDVVFEKLAPHSWGQSLTNLTALRNKEVVVACFSRVYGSNGPYKDRFGGKYCPTEAIYGRDANDGSIIFEVTQEQIAAGSEWSTDGTLWGYGIKATPDGGFVYLTWDHPQLGGTNAFFLFKFNGSGEMEWSTKSDHPHSLSSSAVAGSVNHVAVQENGDIMIQSKASGNYLVLEKFSSDGTSMGVIDYSIAADPTTVISTRTHIEVTGDGGYVITTQNGDKSLVLIKTDANGIIEWVKTFDNLDSVYNSAYCKTSVGNDGNMLVQASLKKLSIPKSNTYIKFLRVDMDGNVYAETPIEIGGVGMGPDSGAFRLNFARSSFESTASNPEFIGVTFCGTHIFDNSTVYTANWIAKIPSDFDFGLEINNPTNLLLPN